MPEFNPTVVLPEIPIADISPLERLLLLAMFDGAYVYGDMVSIAAEHDIDLAPRLFIANLRSAIYESIGFSSQILPAMAKEVADLGAVAPQTRHDLAIDQQFGFPVHLVILQDIVRRSPTIRYFTVATAHPHSGLDSQIGGRATVVTADAIFSRSTDDLIEDFLTQAGLRG